MEKPPKSVHLNMDDEVSDLVKSLLLQRWKPPDEWRLVNIVNELYSSQPPSSSVSSYSLPSSLRNLYADTTSETSFSAIEAERSRRRKERLQAYRRMNLNEFASWLSACNYKYDSTDPLPSVPAKFRHFTSRSYLKLSAIKSINRCPTKWDQLYQPADVNPFFNLCGRLDSAFNVEPQKDGNFSNATVTTKLSESSMSSPVTCLTHLWSDPIGFGVSDTSSTVPGNEDIDNNEKKTIAASDQQTGHGGVLPKEKADTHNSLPKIPVKFPSSLQLAPYGLLCPLLSPLSLGPGCLFFWSRAYFEFNLLSSLPRLTCTKRRKAKHTPVELVSRSSAGVTNQLQLKTKKEVKDSATTRIVRAPAKVPVTSPPKQPRTKPKKATSTPVISKNQRRGTPLKKSKKPLRPIISKAANRTSGLRKPADPVILGTRKRRRRAASKSETTAPKRRKNRDPVVADTSWVKIPSERQMELAAKKEKQAKLEK